MRGTTRANRVERGGAGRNGGNGSDIRYPCEAEQQTHLVLASSSLSNVPCRRSSSSSVMVTSFSLAFDSDVAMGGVTPRCCGVWALGIDVGEVVILAKDPAHPFEVVMIVVRRCWRRGGEMGEKGRTYLSVRPDAGQRECLTSQASAAIPELNCPNVARRSATPPSSPSRQHGGARPMLSIYLQDHNKGALTHSGVHGGRTDH